MYGTDLIHSVSQVQDKGATTNHVLAHDYVNLFKRSLTYQKKNEFFFSIAAATKQREKNEIFDKFTSNPNIFDFNDTIFSIVQLDIWFFFRPV